MSKHYDPNICNDWDDQKLTMCNPSKFEVYIRYTGQVGEGEGKISYDDALRLYDKLKLVEKVAAKLSAGMLKGTLKYKRDTWSVDEWIGYAKDDAADTLNYIFLLEAAREIEKMERGDNPGNSR